MPKCKNDPTRSYKGTEPSPKGLGYCAHGMKEGDKKKGKDGNMWIIKKIKNGSLRWMKIIKEKNIKLYLEPIITIFNTENDDEIFRGLLNKSPKKYKLIIIKYLNKIYKKFFERMMFGIWMYADFNYIKENIENQSAYHLLSPLLGMFFGEPGAKKIRQKINDLIRFKQFNNLEKICINFVS